MRIHLNDLYKKKQKQFCLLSPKGMYIIDFALV